MRRIPTTLRGPVCPVETFRRICWFIWYQAPSIEGRSSFHCVRTPCCFFWFWWSKDFNEFLRVISWVLWKRYTFCGTNVPRAACDTRVSCTLRHAQPDVFTGVELVSRATYISRKRRNWETRQRQSKACKKAERDAKRKLMAQSEISHEAAEQIFRSWATRTDENFLGIIHVSHQLALLHGHANMFFCKQCAEARIFNCCANFR